MTKITLRRVLAVLFPICGAMLWEGISTVALATDPPDGAMTRNALLEPSRFVQIPGPNPILTPGPEDAWDGQIIEASDAFKDFGTYYLYYHGNGGRGYQLGVATAPGPLGPFTKHGKEPVLKRRTQGQLGRRSRSLRHGAEGANRQVHDVVFRSWAIGGTPRLVYRPGYGRESLGTVEEAPRESDP